MNDDNNQPLPDPPASDTLKVLDSKDLFADKTMVLIRHEQELYRLLITKNGKLILQK